MKQKSLQALSLLMVAVFLLGACAPATPTVAPEPTQDSTQQAVIIATSAVQTVEARYTLEAANPVATETLPPATQTATFQAPTLPNVTNTPRPAGGQMPCYAADFVADVTIPDGKLMTPGFVFTKTWRIKNTGTCAWDTDHKIYLERGDAMTTTTSFPLNRKILPNETVDISIAMTAPASEGIYTGFWRIATPYGGSFGVGIYDNSLSVQVTVANKPKNAFAVTGVTYTVTRTPKTGCTNGGAVFSFTATITTNDAGEVSYQWNQYPADQSRPPKGYVTFKDAGSKVVTWQWILKSGAVEGIDRWVSITITSPNNDEEFERIPFHWTCE